MKIKIPTISKYTLGDILTYPSLINPIWLLLIICFIFYTSTFAWFSIVNENNNSYITINIKKHDNIMQEVIIALISSIFNLYYWDKNHCEKIGRLFELIMFPYYKVDDWRQIKEVKEYKKYIHERKK